jgi:GT2 family glycosyltransferase
MQIVDVIILSNTKDLSLYGLTQRTINTLRLSETTYKFDIKIVETNSELLKEGFVYHNCDVIAPKIEFNYNKFLNEGLKHCTNDWIVLCNNDLIFTQNWFSNLMNFQHQHPDIKSLSPFEPIWHVKRGLSADTEVYYGYRTSYEITGWCLVVHRDVIHACELFDENFAFWYQDNDYAETIKSNNFKHALVCNSRVYHVVSGSHHLLENHKKYMMTEGQYNNFNNKWNKN